jgi:hypothetical protein
MASQHLSTTESHVSQLAKPFTRWEMSPQVRMPRAAVCQGFTPACAWQVAEEDHAGGLYVYTTVEECLRLDTTHFPSRRAELPENTELAVASVLAWQVGMNGSLSACRIEFQWVRWILSLHSARPLLLAPLHRSGNTLPCFRSPCSGSMPSSHT